MRSEFCRSSRLIAVATLAALVTIGPGLAAERAPSARRGKTNARSRPTSRSEKGPELFGIAWFDSLEGARKAAGGGKAGGRGKPLDRGKPIFCFRVLGDLDGLM